MLLADLAAGLLGNRTASVLRVLALFDGDGCTVQLAADILDADQKAMLAEVERLTARGIVKRADACVAINRSHIYWYGLAALLDGSLSVEQSISRLAEQLAGPGTRVALFGAPATQTAQFDSAESLVMLYPGTRPLSPVSAVDEIIAMIEAAKRTTFIQHESDDAKLQILATGDAEVIRAWLHADDVRSWIVKDVGATLNWTRRDISVGRAGTL